MHAGFYLYVLSHFINKLNNFFFIGNPLVDVTNPKKNVLIGITSVHFKVCIILFKLGKTHTFSSQTCLNFTEGQTAPNSLHTSF